MKVRTRFAPSPTGKQHMGNIRTALYSWLMAKHHGGTFILRIEDTDQSRRVPGAVRSIIEELTWFGVDIDEGPTRDELKLFGEDWDSAPDIGGAYGPYIQSHRLSRYREVAELLIEKGVAYRADFPEGEEGDLQAPHTIRLIIPKERSVQSEDGVHGLLHFESVSLNDPVLLKSDGYPTYHLAVVVDDHDMEITHVFRGDEWIATFPIHILLYEALGWEMPLFCHMPTVLGSDGKKLSKRHGATTSEMFRANGYLPHALLNYTALVGWSAGDDKEIYSRDELIKAFSIKGIHSAGGIFDYAKLEWMNGVHLRALSHDKFVALSAPFLVEEGLNTEVCANAFDTVAPAVQERVKTLKEVPQWVSFLFSDREFLPEWDSAVKKGFTVEQAKSLVEPIREAWAHSTFTPEGVENGLKEIAEAQGLKVGSIFGLVRVALLGGFHTPPLGLSITAIGKEVALKRLAAILHL